MSDSNVMSDLTNKAHSVDSATSGPVSIIVPAFNEVGIIGPVLDTIIHQMSANGAQYELMVVDDGLPDLN